MKQFDEVYFRKYLNLLGLSKRKPSLEALKELVSANLQLVPFENVSKLYYKKQNRLKNIPDFPQFLEGIEKYHFGGTCYSNNYYLYLLLQYLGYNVKLCGADMNNPDVHIVSIVNVEGKEFIVDNGYAAPFSEPMPRNLNKDYTLTFGDEKYILKPKNNKGYSKLEQYWKGELKHGYIAKPKPRKIEEFQKVIEDSYRDDATFMNALMIARFYNNGSLVLRNLSLIKTKGSKTRTQVINRADIPDIVENEFGISSQIVKEVTEDLGELKDTWD